MVLPINCNTNNQVCELCGSYFSCNSKKIKDCWCFNEPHVVVDYSIKNCICNKCLEKKKILKSQ